LIKSDSKDESVKRKKRKLHVMETRLIFPLHLTIHVSAHKIGVVNSKYRHYKQ